jgi:predicted nucleic acid-binding protein
VNYWADANLLIRLVTKQPAEHFQRARAILQRAETEGFQLCVHSLVVAECVYVLEGVYEYSREQLSQDLRTVLAMRVLEVRELGVTLATLEAYAQSTLDFVDLFLVELARESGQGVASFDRDFETLEIPWLEP